MPVRRDSGVSALVPVLNEAARLTPFLERLRLIGADEIVVADGGSKDGSIDIAKDFADKVVIGTPGRGRQIASAAQKASFEVLWIVHCDCTPPQGAIKEIANTLAQKDVRMGAFPIAFDASHPILRCYSFLSRFDSPISTFGDQGFFLRAADYWRIGGAPDTALFEDVELRRRIIRLGKIAKPRLTMETSARHFRKHGIIRQQIVNGILLARYFAGASPDVLARSYYKSRVGGVTE